MNTRSQRTIMKLIAASALVAGLTACQPSGAKVTPVNPDNGSQASTGAESGGASGDGRRLTVVKGPAGQASQDIAIARIHRLEGVSLDRWKSDDLVQITTTELVKPGTETQEPEYAYLSSTYDVTTGVKSGEGKNEETAAGRVVKEEISPDGAFSFIQEWQDKYTARNWIKNRQTGEKREIKGPTYLETGSWMDNDTYILAPGSKEGRGELLSIQTDGTVFTLQLNDLEVEAFGQFGAAQGRIFYTDNNRTLKSFDPKETKPVSLLKQVDRFDISPDRKWIAVTLRTSTGLSGTELRLFDPAGSPKGTLMAKGDTVTYTAWSPDSSKLAFAVYTEETSGMNGVYVLDSASGKVSLVGPGYYPTYPLSWNPSGTRLGVTFSGDQSLPVTEIIDFK